MELHVEKTDGVSVVTVPGESLDAANVGEFKRGMAPILKDSSKVVLNIENLKFVDSSGLGSFLSCLRSLNEAGGDMKISGLTRPVKSLFELIRMHRICDVYETSGEAVKAFEP
ncbi:STAS domain-containing protein [bacterium]|nr:STAS domain-containing protein [bacterium]